MAIDQLMSKLVDYLCSHQENDLSDDDGRMMRSSPNRLRVHDLVDRD